MEPTFRAAETVDATGMAHVYLAAFPESIQYFFSNRPPRVEAVADLLSIPLRAEPGCGIVALVAGEVAGYVIAPARMSQLRSGLRGGHLGRMLRRWFSGRYRVGLRAVLRLARNQLSMPTNDPHKTEAHILSIAVHPERQGMGLGKELLRRALGYLRSAGAERVRLEVRPDNAPAIHLYERFGFVTVSRTRDLRGEWLIMLLEGL